MGGAINQPTVGNDMEILRFGVGKGDGAITLNEARLLTNSDTNTIASSFKIQGVPNCSTCEFSRLNQYYR